MVFYGYPRCFHSVDGKPLFLPNCSGKGGGGLGEYGFHRKTVRGGDVLMQTAVVSRVKKKGVSGSVYGAGQQYLSGRQHKRMFFIVVRDDFLLCQSAVLQSETDGFSSAFECDKSGFGTGGQHGQKEQDEYYMKMFHV